MHELLTYLNHISPLKDNTRAALLPLFSPMRLKKNELFARGRAYAQQIGFLKKGIMRAFLVNEAGKEYTKQFFVDQSLVGAYTSLVSKRPNQIAQQALTDCELWVANFSEIEKLFGKFHDLERLGRKIAEGYFQEKEQKEIEMALLDAHKRYALMRERFPTLEALVPQYHIASYLGITPTQLSRIRNSTKN